MSETPEDGIPFEARAGRSLGSSPPIGYHGIIGDLHTSCLIGKNGHIDWYCYPHFDDDPIFCGLLDEQQGGRFAIDLIDGEPMRQLYLPDTNVLLTRLLGPSGQLEITDFMPVKTTNVKHEGEHWHGLIRRARSIRGNVDVRLDCRPTFRFAKQAPTVTATKTSTLFEGPDRALRLTSPMPLDTTQGPPGTAGAHANFRLPHGESAWFTLCDDREGNPYDLDPHAAQSLASLLDETVFNWREWIDRCRYDGRWQSHVRRSALTLKLLTFAPTGAIVAAPTTSLPEKIGKTRNWDYRYTWLRDAVFTLRALFRLGFHEEGISFLDWLVDRIHEAATDDPIQAVYGIDGRHHLPEETIDHLEGYRSSRPVRLGNAAHSQRQLDVYGSLLEAVSDYADRIDDLERTWEALLPLMSWLSDHWREPDESIWEIRGQRQHFVYSKTMCWVAFDRAIRLAEAYDLPGNTQRWKQERAAIRHQVNEHGVDPKKGYFKQHYDTNTLDASNLRIPLFGFLPPDDPRVQATVKNTVKNLTTDGLVHRYRSNTTPDGLPDGEGTFSLCSFWLVDNLVLQGEIDEAWLEFEKLLTHSNHLNLFAEQIGIQGTSLGNFPQAFTHIGLIHSALLLDKALTAKRMARF